MLLPRRAPRRLRRPTHSSWVVGALCVLGITFGSTAVRADDSVTDGVRTLTVSKSIDLSGEGETIVVSGTGYDESKGVYVGLCVITSPDEQPSPCGGGIDREGATGASEWISSNPPSYAIGLPIPYEPGGSFSVELSVTPSINEVVDCRAVSCAIVTKNDHTIISDRSQDLIIPVTFTGVAPSTTTRPPAESTIPSEIAPEITVADGVSDLAEVATSEGENDSSVIVVIVVIIAAVLIVSVAVIAVRRRSKSNLR